MVKSQFTSKTVVTETKKTPKPSPALKPEWDKLSQKGREIIRSAADQGFKIAKLMDGLSTFCQNVDQSTNPALYDFSFALSGMLDQIKSEGYGVYNKLARLWDAKLMQGGKA